MILHEEKRHRMQEYYDMIFKRKSFHLFRNTEDISEQELEELKAFVQAVKPLDDTIKTSIEIVEEKETTCKRGAQYCILFYSEKKNAYLRNIGYIGEQIDLYCASKNIGCLWFGIGKVEEKAKEGMEYVIMIAISKMPEDKFRKDMFKAKRKPLEEIWQGEIPSYANIVRFAPSACNTQPWMVENKKDALFIYRYKKPGKRGIMPVDKVSYYNHIDLGIFLFILEVCLEHENIHFSKELFEDTDDTKEKVLVAKYEFN